MILQCICEEWQMELDFKCPKCENYTETKSFTFVTPPMSIEAFIECEECGHSEEVLVQVDYKSDLIAESKLNMPFFTKAKAMLLNASKKVRVAK